MRRQTILLLSPDLDLCVSLRLFLQDTYDIRTMVDKSMFLTTARAYNPSIIIIDEGPSERMKSAMEALKREKPSIRYILFASKREGFHLIPPPFRSLIDLAISKPVELEELTTALDFLTSKSDHTVRRRVLRPLVGSIQPT